MRQYHVGAPFERIVIDIPGPFLKSEKDKKYALVTMDSFSKWPEAYAILNQETITIVDQLIPKWVIRFVVPWELYSDQ